MESIRRRNPQAALNSLEAAAVSARGGFACMFSTAEEFEAALISERRANGRYASRWPIVLFVGCAMMMVGAVLLLNLKAKKDG